MRTWMLIALVMFVFGCSQPTAAPEVPEKAGGIEQPESEEEHAGIITKTCSDFYGPQDAQAYFESKATAAEKRVLNSDGDEWACNEAGVTFRPEPEIALSAIDELDDRQTMGLLQCQFIKYAEDHGQQAANEYIDQALDEELGGGEITNPNADITSIQEHFIQDGYSCTWHEVNETMMRAAASDSAPTSMGDVMSQPPEE